MALLGTSKSKTNTSTITANNGNYGASNINFTGSIGGGKNSKVDITLSDYNAVQGGLGLASQALAANQKTFESAIGAVQSNASSVLSKAFDLSNKTQLSESAQMQDTLIKLGLVGAVAFGLWTWAKKG